MSATVIVIIGVALLVLVPLYFLTTRSLRRPAGGRKDPSERQELTGTEQYKHRKID